MILSSFKIIKKNEAFFKFQLLQLIKSYTIFYPNLL